MSKCDLEHDMLFPLPFFFFFCYSGFRSHQHTGIMFSAIDLGRTEHEPKELVSSLLSPRVRSNRTRSKNFSLLRWNHRDRLSPPCGVPENQSQSSLLQAHNARRTLSAAYVVKRRREQEMERKIEENDLSVSSLASLP